VEVVLLLLLAFSGYCNATMADGGVEHPTPAARSCERLKGSLTYTQQDAPDDVSLVVRLNVLASVCERSVLLKAARNIAIGHMPLGYRSLCVWGSYNPLLTFVLSLYSFQL
jgi:hypothetical protein